MPRLSYRRRLMLRKLLRVLGIVLAVWMTTVHWKRYGGNFDQILDITLVAVPSGIIGARIYHIITTPERFFGPTGAWSACRLGMVS